MADDDARGRQYRRWTGRVATLSFVALAAAMPRTGVAQAQVADDPAGDFLSTFVGPTNPDLDVRHAQVFFDGSSFLFTSMSNGAIGTTSNALFVWGVNRGSGMAGFPTLAPGVLFDWVLVLQPGGTSMVRDLRSGTATPLAAGAVTFVGNNLHAMVPLGLLPSQGFAPEQYTANLWPRVGVGNNNQISDFAPDNSNIAVSTVPEPATLLLVAPAMAGLVLLRRHRRR